MKQQRKKQKAVEKGVIKQEAQPKKTQHKPKNDPEQLPSIEVMLKIPVEDRTAKAAEHFKKIRPFCHSYILKKQGSRVIQLIFKWGSPEVKSSIFQIIKKHWKELIKSTYALHAISKVCSEFQFPQLVEDAVALQNNPEGAKVLENFIKKHPNSPKTAEIFNIFQNIKNLAQTEGFDSQEPLHNLAMRSIEKQYYHFRISKFILRLSLQTMIETERSKAIEFLVQNSLNLIDDEEGVRLFIEVINYCDSKQKKGIIKEVKGKLPELMGQCHVSYVALIKLMTEIDDTVLIGKKIVPDLLELLPEMEKNNKISHILISLLSPRTNNFNCLGKFEHEVKFTYCKKQEEQRKKEIRQFLYQPLVQYLTSEETIDSTCLTPAKSRLALGLLKSMQSDGSEHLKPFAVSLCKHFLSNLITQQIENSKQLNVKEALVANNFGSKLIKNILGMQEPYLDKYCDKFSEAFSKNLNETLTSKASFVLTVIIEKGGRDWVLKEIKNAGINFSNIVAGQFYSNRLRSSKK